MPTTSGDWVLRSDRGATGRANSARATGDPGRSIPDAVQEVIHWYRHRQLRPRIQVFDGAPPSLSAELDHRQWQMVVGAEIMSASIDGDHLGVFAMNTVATVRRSGVATQLLHDLAEHGAHLGARSVWLQVRPDNSPAVQLYNQLGFTRVRGYHDRLSNT